MRQLAQQHLQELDDLDVSSEPEEDEAAADGDDGALCLSLQVRRLLLVAVVLLLLLLLLLKMTALPQLAQVSWPIIVLMTRHCHTLTAAWCNDCP
jgi:hypothetical protein